jgi:hypothetical protein
VIFRGRWSIGVLAQFNGSKFQRFRIGDASHSTVQRNPTVPILLNVQPRRSSSHRAVATRSSGSIAALRCDRSTAKYIQPFNACRFAIPSNASYLLVLLDTQTTVPRFRNCENMISIAARGRADLQTVSPMSSSRQPGGLCRGLPASQCKDPAPGMSYAAVYWRIST